MVTTFQLNPDAVMREMARHLTMGQASEELPEGAYTTFRTYQAKRVLRIDQHLHRLEESLALSQQHAPPINSHLARMAVGRIISMLHYPEARLRLTYAPSGLYISIEPFTPYPESLYDAGVWCATVSLHRDNPHAKSTTFITTAADAYGALPPNTHEGLMIAGDGAVLEGLSSNFFAVKDAQASQGPALYTEDARVLAGVTRSLVLELAQGVLPVAKQAVTYAALTDLSECFITSVSREVMPVVKIDELQIGNGKPGPVTRSLRQKFQDLVEREAETLL